MVTFLTGVNEIWSDGEAVFEDLGIDEFDPVTIGAASSNATLVLTAMRNRLEALETPAGQEIRTLKDGFKQSLVGMEEIFGALGDSAAGGELSESAMNRLGIELLSTMLALTENVLLAGEAQAQLLSQYAIPATEVGFDADDWGM